MGTAKADEIELRRAKAIKLRVSGYTVREIAAELGVSVGSAHNDLKVILEANRAEAKEDAEDHRDLDLLRLDRGISAVMPHITTELPELPFIPDGTEPAQIKAIYEEFLASHTRTKLEAVDKLVKLQGARAKLLGLDAPAKHDVTTITANPAEAARLVREKFGAQAAARSEEPAADGSVSKPG